MSHKILIVLVICALSIQALALSCFSCHDRNRGVNCVDRQHEEMVSCNDPVPSQDTNSFLGDYFKIGANTTGSNYVCINVYANFSEFIQWLRSLHYVTSCNSQRMGGTFPTADVLSRTHLWLVTTCSTTQRRTPPFWPVRFPRTAHRKPTLPARFALPIDAILVAPTPWWFIPVSSSSWHSC